MLNPLMKSSRRQALLAAVVILWLFVVVAAYYLFHRPFDQNNILGIADTLGTMGVVCILLTLAAVLGRCALRAFAFESPREALVIQIGVGYGIIAFGVLGLGFAGLIESLVLWGVVIAALALLHRDVMAVARELHSIGLPRRTQGENLLAVFIGLALAIALVFSLTPPTGWDGLQYHLVLPKLALEDGRFLPPPDNVMLSYPSLVEMLFLAAMGMKGDAAAQVIHWSYLVLMVGGVLLFAGKYFTWRIGWVAAALLVAVPSILLISTYAYNDIALMFYTLTALFWTLRALHTQQKRDFALAGVLAGLAMGEKYTASFVPLALGAIVLFHEGRRMPRRNALANGLLLGLAAFAMALPWYLRNYFFVGNPFYPFLFGGLYWDGWRAAWYSRFGTGLLNEPLQLALVPLTATIEGFQGGFFDATIGALLLALLPFNLLPAPRETRDAPTRAMWFLVAVLFVFWLVGVAESKLLWQTRLLFPAFPVLAILAAEGWNRLSAIQLPNLSAQRMASLVIALVLGLNVVSNLLAVVRNRPLEVLLGMETREEFLVRNLGGYYALAQWINANLPDDARVVSLWETRGYYIDRKMEPDASLDRMAHLQFLYAGDANAITADWQRQGYTHLVLFREGLDGMLQSGYDPVGDAEIKTLQRLEDKHLRLIYGNAKLELTNTIGRPGLSDAKTNPYAVYEILRDK